MIAFTNIVQGKKRVAFASPYPGKIWVLSYGGGFNRKEEGGILGGLGNLLDGDGR